jgi:hypothetical protein
MKAYRKNILWEVGTEESKKIEIARHYYNTVKSSIDLFLRDKTKKMEVRLETAKSDFKEFWSRIGAVGPLEEAIREWDQSYNASDSARDPESEVSSKTDSRRPILIRAGNKMVRIARKLPSFLRRA